MIDDLTGAGRRLADTRLGPTPPVADLEGRRDRRRRHRRLIGSGTLVALFATGALIVALLTGRPPRSDRVTTQPTTGPSGQTVTAPPSAAPGSRPYDYLRLRLWLPPDWAADDPCPSGDGLVAHPPVVGQGCPALAGLSAVRVGPMTTSPPPPARRVAVNGVTVWMRGNPTGATWWIPSLQVELDLTGRGAQQVAGTVQPSPLQRILTGTFPVAIPPRWKTVAYQGFTAKVPAAWTVNRIRVTRDSTDGRTPSLCGGPLFDPPAVYLGGPVVVGCLGGPSRRPAPAPSDGLWLQPATGRTSSSSSSTPGDQPQVVLTRGAERLTVTGTAEDDVAVVVNAPGHRLFAIIGLGSDPSVAAAILSSIQLSHQ